VVSDALPGGSPGGSVVMIDANGIVASDEGLVLDTARHASLEFDDDVVDQFGGIGGSPPAETTTVSLLQTNSVALRCERHWRHVARAGSVALLTGATWA
jgi:hypothetical protein